MGNAAAADERPALDELEELYRLDASEPEPEDDDDDLDDDDEDEDDDDDEDDNEEHPEDMPHG